MLIEEATQRLRTQKGAVDVSSGPRTADRIANELLKNKNGNIEDIIVVGPSKGKWTIDELQTNIVNTTQQRVNTLGHLIIQDAHQASSAGHDFLLRTVEEPEGNWLLWFCRPKDSQLPTALRSRMTHYVNDTKVDQQLIEIVIETYDLDAHVAKVVCELLLDPLNATANETNGAIVLADPKKLMTEPVTDAAARTVTGKLWTSLDVTGRNKARRLLVDAAGRMEQFCVQKASESQQPQRATWINASESWKQTGEGIATNIAPNVAWSLAKKQTPAF